MYGRALALALAISCTTAPLAAQRRPAAEGTARAVRLVAFPVTRMGPAN